MMNGTVIGLQARMSIIICAPQRGEVEIECVIDTGFEGFLTLTSTKALSFGIKQNVLFPFSPWDAARSSAPHYSIAITSALISGPVAQS
jgi:hypothetical protein